MNERTRKSVHGAMMPGAYCPRIPVDSSELLKDSDLGTCTTVADPVSNFIICVRIRSSSGSPPKSHRLFMPLDIWCAGHLASRGLSIQLGVLNLPIIGFDFHIPTIMPTCANDKLANNGPTKRSQRSGLNPNLPPINYTRSPDSNHRGRYRLC